MAEKYSQAERDEMAKDGTALPDGSYPIKDAEDLDSALVLAESGHGDDMVAIRKHIMARAKALALFSKIPATWESDGTMKAPDEKKAAGDTKTCPRCDGDTTVDLGAGPITCPTCDGDGTVEDDEFEEDSHRAQITHLSEVRDAYRQIPESRTTPRAISHFEIREVANGTGGTNLRFTGFASVTGDDNTYEMEDWLGGWDESIGLTAFDNTLNQDADVAFLLNHQGMTLARTKPGTLKLSAEKDANKSPVYGVTGLHSEALLDPQNPTVTAMRSAVERGDLDEMSFAFRVLRQEWNSDYTRRYINEVSLDKGDVSLVNYGANPLTGGTVSMRQKVGAFGTRGATMDSGRLVAMVKRSKLLTATFEIREGKVLSAANASKLQEALDALHSTDDADIPGIVKQLQAIDAALDAGQGAISAVLSIADPDGDAKDLEPALDPPPDEKHAYDDSDLEYRIRIAKQKGWAA